MTHGLIVSQTWHRTHWWLPLAAVALFADQGRALLSQYPMLVLMVGYTMLSLWIIAQPIVETG